MLRICLASMVFLQSLHFVTFGASSISFAVLLIASALIFLLGLPIKMRRPRGLDLLMLAATLAIVAKAAVDTIMGLSVEMVASLVGILTLIAAGLATSKALNSIGAGDRKGLFQFVAVASLIFLVVSISARVKIAGYDHFPKNVFPFSEPSHFAIFCGPFLAVSALLSGPLARFFWVLAPWLGGALLPSLVMILQGIFSVILFAIMPMRKIRILILVLSTVFSTIIAVPILNSSSSSAVLPEYFSSRLKFFRAENNSTLVYLQGWERAFTALRETSGAGVGFQNLEVVARGRYGDRIYEKLGVEKNLKDGGFLAAKIVGELGLLGLMFVAVYLVYFFNALAALRQQLRLQKSERGRTFGIEGRASLLSVGNTLVVFFVFELFVRGVGYFTPGVVMFFSGVFIRVLCARRSMP